MTIDEALTKYKSNYQLASVCNVTVQAVNKWIKNDFIPYPRQAWLEHLTNGELKADDVFNRELTRIKEKTKIAALKKIEKIKNKAGLS